MQFPLHQQYYNNLRNYYEDFIVLFLDIYEDFVESPWSWGAKPTGNC